MITRLVACLSVASMFSACGVPANDAKLVSSGGDNAVCLVKPQGGSVAKDTSGASGSKSSAVYVPNPGFTTDPKAEVGPYDTLPVRTTTNGEKIVAFPGGMTADGNPIISPETAVTDIDGYPYKTYQSETQGNCAPRAFEAKTGVYNPYLESSMNGDETSVNAGGKTFVPYSASQKPNVGDVVFYKPFPGSEAKHAGIVTGADDNGNVTIATGWQQEPYQTTNSGQVLNYWSEKK